MRSLATFLLAAALLVPLGASAKSDKYYGHSYDQVWNTAIRLIRVDERFPVRDRDEAIGFFLFDYQERGRAYPGSVELIRAKQDGADKVRVVMKVPAMPSYVEQILLDKLGRKLEQEYGEPPRPEKKPEPPRDSPPDGTPPDDTPTP